MLGRADSERAAAALRTGRFRKSGCGASDGAFPKELPRMRKGLRRVLCRILRRFLSGDGIFTVAYGVSAVGAKEER